MPANANEQEFNSCSRWLPIDLRLAAHPATVHWIRALPNDLSAPFFIQSVSELRKRTPRPAERLTDLATLAEAGRSLFRKAPAGLIFHVSRCGSTLISNALRLASNAIVVSEAPAFNSLLMPNLTTRGSREALFRYVARVFAHHSDNPDGRLVIKFSSWNLLSIAFIRSLWPTVPCLIVIRDPIEVMVSNLSAVGGWMNFRASTGMTRMMLGEVPRIAPEQEEFCARVLGRFYEAAAGEVGTGCQVVDYENLDAPTIRSVAKLFRLELGARDDERLHAVLNVYSKDSQGTTVFEPDAARKLRQATDATRTAAAKWAYPAYYRLRDAKHLAPV